ncbi:unnamed protein product, partial [Ectocarpus sp. 12 AP-2014]
PLTNHLQIFHRFPGAFPAKKKYPPTRLLCRFGGWGSEGGATQTNANPLPLPYTPLISLSQTLQPQFCTSSKHTRTKSSKQTTLAERDANIRYASSAPKTK